jgi:hypothetical protein
MTFNPLSAAPDIDVSRVQRVADATFQFHMLTRRFQVSTTLGGASGVGEQNG